MTKIVYWNIIILYICKVCLLSEMMGLRKTLAKNVEFKEFSDEQVVSLAQAGDTSAMEHIVSKYTEFVKKRSGPYFLAGAEREDLIQEGLIGLYKAVKSFDGGKRANFKTFAEVCIVRQMITAVKTSTRKKNNPLNHYISIHGTDNGTVEDNVYDKFIDSQNINPESIMIEKENARGMEFEISKLLSDFENKVLGFYLSGVSYKEIAAYLNKEPKAVDNALTRIKKKIEKYIAGE